MDAKTQEPIESAAVYFDNTTIGTSTNHKGEFQIAFNADIRSPLIISFLGYQKLTLFEYDPNTYYNVLLEEQNDVLDEVVIVADDGMPRALKLNYFRSQFLGESKNAKSCVILNEKDLILRFNKKTKQLTASSKVPLIIKNKNLAYEIQYDIKDFTLQFGYVNLDTKSFYVESLFYTGTSFYASLDDRNSVIKKRNQAYEGSVLHFMRSLAKQELEDERYMILSDGFKVDPEKYISVQPIKSSDSVEVKFRLPLSVLYKRKHQSDLMNNHILKQMRLAHAASKHKDQTDDKTEATTSNSKTLPSNNQPYFNTTIVIDGFGNYSPIEALNFIGYMSQFRIGDTLPLDYVPTE